jgi:hypothetical protein
MDNLARFIRDGNGNYPADDGAGGAADYEAEDFKGEGGKSDFISDSRR